LIKNSCLSGVFALLLLSMTTPVIAEDILGQLQLMQRQIQALQDEVHQKQQQIDLMKNKLDQVIKQQELQQSQLSSVPRQKEPAGSKSVFEQANADKNPKTSSDDEVLFSDGAVFASGEQQERWPGWLNTFNINGNTSLRFEAGSNQQFNQGFSDTFRLSDFNLDFSFEPTSVLDVRLGLQMKELITKNPVRQGLKIDDNGAFNHQFVIKYAYADYEFNEWFRLRFGAFLTPFGVYNESLHTDYDAKLVERPFLSEEIVPAPWTQLGAQLYGDVMITPAWHMNYAVYMSNGLEAAQDKNGVIKSSRISDMSHQLVSRFNSNRATGGRLGLLANDGQHHFEFGLSAYHGAWNPNATLNLNMLGSDVWYHYDGLDLRAEWALAAQDIAQGKQYDYSWYTQAAYRWHLFEPVLRFDRLRNRYVDQNGAFIDDRHRYSVGLNFYLGKFFILKTSYAETIFSVARRHDHRFISALTAGF